MCVLTCLFSEKYNRKDGEKYTSLKRKKGTYLWNKEKIDGKVKIRERVIIVFLIFRVSSLKIGLWNLSN